VITRLQEDAIHEGHAAVVGLLLEKGADINAGDAKGRTALHAAVKGREVEREVERLRAGYGVGVAVRAARKEHRTVIRLLKNHADINTTANHGKRPTSEGMEERSFLSEEVEEGPSKRARYR
jgi:hypothetical protein